MARPPTPGELVRSPKSGVNERGRERAKGQTSPLNRLWPELSRGLLTVIGIGCLL